MSVASHTLASSSVFRPVHKLQIIFSLQKYTTFNVGIGSVIVGPSAPDATCGENGHPSLSYHGRLFPQRPVVLRDGLRDGLRAGRDDRDGRPPVRARRGAIYA